MSIRYTRSFKPDDAALVTVVPLHVEVAVVCDGEYVGGHFTDLLVGVEADLVSSVDWQQLVRVDGHQDGAGVRLHTERQSQGEGMKVLGLKTSGISIL